jgi:hypothetical protein
VSYPWLHDSEMAAARAEHAAGDLPGEDGRAFQRRLEASAGADPEFRAWAARAYLERWGAGRPAAEPAGPEAGG